MGELVRFPLERRSQQRPCGSLPEHEAKVLELKPRTHVREFAGIPIVESLAMPNGALMFSQLGGSWPFTIVSANGEFSYGAGTGSDAGGSPSTG